MVCRCPFSDSSNPNVWKGKRYDIPNEALLGACFLPYGLGTICILSISGYLNASGRLTSSVSSWGTNRGTNIRVHSDHLEEEAGWYMVSRGPIKGIFDAFRSFSPNFVARIWDDKQICWREPRPHRMSHMPFLQRFRCELYIMRIRVATQYSRIIVQVEMAFGPCAAYIIDVMHSRSAESLAANGWGARPTRTDDRSWRLTAIDWSGLRSALMAGGTALVLPMINTYGIAVTNAVCAVMVWISFGYVRSVLLFMPSWFRRCVRILCCIIRYGDWMRAYRDVGFSTGENNWQITNEGRRKD